MSVSSKLRWGIAIPGRHDCARCGAIAMREDDCRWEDSMAEYTDTRAYMSDTAGAHDVHGNNSNVDIVEEHLKKVAGHVADVLKHVFKVREVAHMGFSAAGAYGYSYAGIMTFFEHALGARNGPAYNEVFEQVKSYNGCSAGSLAALAFASGVSATQMQDFILRLDVAALLEHDICLTRPAAEGAMNVLLDRYVVNHQRQRHATDAKTPRGLFVDVHSRVSPGLLPGTFLTNFARCALSAWCGNSDITFRDLYEKTHNTLNVIATDLDRCSAFVFSNDTTPDLPVHIALRASMSVPAVFVPIDVDRHLLTDGGLIDAGPLTITPPGRTVTFRVGLNSYACERNVLAVLRRITHVVTEFQYEFHKRWLPESPVIVPMSPSNHLTSTGYDASAVHRRAAMVQGSQSVLMWCLSVALVRVCIMAVTLCRAALRVGGGGGARVAHLCAKV